MKRAYIYIFMHGLCVYEHILELWTHSIASWSLLSQKRAANKRQERFDSILTIESDSLPIIFYQYDPTSLEIRG